jgi:putative endopeptidase
MKATLLCCGLALSACRLFGQSTASAPPAHTSQSGLDLDALDKTASPCVDFYQYACGNWLKENPIPPDKATWGRFDELEERNLRQLRQISEDSAAHQDRLTIDQKIGAFYASCMDEAVIEKRGLDPLRPGLDRIARIKSKPELTAGIAWLHQHGAEPFFAFHVSPDLTKSTTYLPELDQGGLGLPDRDYYLKADAKSEEIRQKYLAHVAKIFELTGVPVPEAQRKAAAVMKIETALAELSLDNVSRRNPQLLLHRYKLDDTAKLTSAVDLKKFFTVLGTPTFTDLNVDVPAFFEGFDKLFAATPLAELKDYLEWFYISANADLLAEPIIEETFDFYGRTLTGADQLAPRWKRCVEATDAQLGEALGQRFVEKTFGEEGKQRTLELVSQIERAMAADIDSLPWMSDETKKQALIKLKAVTNKIGYPNKWRDYSSVTVANVDYFGNYGRAEDFELKRQLAKIGKPVDRAEWDMTPPTVNAYYDPQQNNINFPAGILQPPFYSNHADVAVMRGQSAP